MDDDDLASSYRWEQTVSAWDSEIREDDSGNIIATQYGDQHRIHKAKERRVTESVRRGLIRYLVLAIDCSVSAAEKDYRPNRLSVIKSVLEDFILHFFDQNPISQIGMTQIYDRVSEKLTDLSGNPKAHIQRLRQVLTTEGLASLQNALIQAIDILQHIPDYGHRELLIIYNSLSSTDPGNIDNTIDMAVKNKIRVSIVCLSAEIYICKKITEKTGGTFSVATDASHLIEILKTLVPPSPETSSFASSGKTEFVYMGFPRRVLDVNENYGFDGKHPSLGSAFYICPRCFTKTTDIPTQCCSCTLQLNFSSHIARSHHHIFPVPNFEEVVLDSIGTGVNVGPKLDVNINNALISPGQNQVICCGCSETIKNEDICFVCPTGGGSYCIECDLFIHDNLHNCCC